jgi:hypothetical protein
MVLCNLLYRYKPVINVIEKILLVGPTTPVGDLLHSELGLRVISTPQVTTCDIDVHELIMFMLAV